MPKVIAGTISYFCVTCGLFRTRSYRRAIAHVRWCKTAKRLGMCSKCGQYYANAYETTRRNLCWACFNDNLFFLD